ncbi:hypothetical protein BJ170DRAFT_590126 [Xylariales sp. AK1849]|nr:hypothetical protein BJ170DRAFT_590126 [Xylariales sp. AK1849]
MARLRGHSLKAVMATHTNPSFTAMPTEILLKIMKEMGVRELTALALSNKHLFAIFTENQATILTTVLLRQPELEPMLLVYTVDKRDFYIDAMLHPRKISYYFDDINRQPIDLMLSSVAFREGKLICPRKILLSHKDLSAIWKMIKVVDWWVEEYPRIRWYKNPEDSRCLRSSEQLRLRKAISRWWLYAECFHSNWASYHLIPKMWQTDDRLHHLRVMSSMEIRELEDLWETVRATVQRDICSSIEPKGWKRVPWGWDEWRSKDIVNTYLKLDPAQLKHLIEKSPRLNKAALIRVARQSQPRTFDAEQETLSWSIDIVLQERLLLKTNAITDIPSSGIIDEDSYNDAKGLFTSDAWLTGKPPLTKQEVLSYPTWPNKCIPFGDDGHDLDY